MATFEQLTGRALDLHRALCGRNGRDPDDDLTVARFAGGHTVARWVVECLAAEALDEPMPEPSEPIRRDGALAGFGLDIAAWYGPDRDAILAILVATGSDPLASAALRHPDCPASVLEHATSLNARTVQLVAVHPATPAELLVRLANHESPIVCRAVADNPNAPTDALRKLASHSIPFVRAAACRHAALPDGVIGMLVTDTNLGVRKAIACNRSPWITPHLDALANDRTAMVRRCVATNPRTSTETLRRLVTDPSKVAAKQAAEALRKRRNHTPVAA